MPKLLRLSVVAAFILSSALPVFGGAYEDGEIAYSNGDFAVASKKFKQAAAENDKRAQFNLGIMYALGQGIEQDAIKANMWLNLSAGRGGNGVNNNEILASGFSPQQFARLEKLMADCRSSKLQNCDEQFQMPARVNTDVKAIDKPGKHKAKHLKNGHKSAKSCANHKKAKHRC